MSYYEKKCKIYSAFSQKMEKWRKKSCSVEKPARFEKKIEKSQIYVLTFLKETVFYFQSALTIH